MLKISWKERIENDIILQLLYKKRVLLGTVKRRKLKYFGYIICEPKYRLLQIITEYKVEGKRWVEIKMFYLY